MTAGSFLSSTRTTFDVYPLSYREKFLLEPDLHFKTVHVVRHAEGHHNVNKEYRDEKNIDASLTEYGQAQCRALATHCEQHQLLEDAQLVVTSPMTRCVQTALLSFPALLNDDKVPFVAHEDIRETVNYACDRRRSLSDIIKDYPQVDYSLVDSEHDSIWHHYFEKLGSPQHHQNHRESGQLYKVAERGRSFFRWLETRKEQEVVLCSHSAFLRCIKSWGHPGGVPMMPEQHLDDREEPVDVPILQYCGDEPEFERYMRNTYDNCELRSFLIVFGPTKVV